MTNESDLIKKLMISKQIMDKHKEMPRAGNQLPMNEDYSSPDVQDFQAPQAKYSLPEEFMSEPKSVSPQPITEERVMSSKLPDEIKKLMIEHPINQPSSPTGPSLSNDLVEKAARLMNTNAAGQQTKKIQPTQKPNIGIDSETIKSIVRETIEEVLAENGLLIESTSKSNDVFSFRVGKHIFEGKLTKIKKVQ
jgi:hypothetical protein